MNFEALLNALKKKWWVVISSIIVLALAAVIVTWQMPQKYDAGSTATAIRGTNIKQTDVDYYLYDNYYAIQSGAFIADNIVSWLASPPAVAAIYKDANIDLPPSNLRALSKIFAAKKQSASSNVITFTTANTDSDKAYKLITSANKYLTQLVAEINKDQKDEGSHFSVYFSEPVVVKVPKSYALNTLVAAFLGLVIGTAIAVYRPDK